MRSLGRRPGGLVPVLLVLAGIGLGRYFGVGVVAAPKLGEASRAQETGAAPATLSEVAVLDLRDVADPSHRAQIASVVEAMDLTGAPPQGVVQGGRRGGRPGMFENVEGRLPRKNRGYWIESDVWPKKGPRDGERLIFGRGREVYWTLDHYETFMRLR